MLNMSQFAKVSTALDFLAAAAADDRKGASLDMKGFESVLIIVKFSGIAAGAATSIKVQQSEDTNDAHFADLKGTGVAVADDDDDQLFLVDIVRPTERYIRVYVDKDGANATNECAIYVQYNARELPVTQQVDDEVTYELHVEPDEGTA